MTFSIVPAHLAVKAMRDNGYKNAAYAVAELMDNSVQAGAKHVELLCAEQVIANAQRDRRRIAQIAVLDDASGMDSETLRIALQFGNGIFATWKRTAAYCGCTGSKRTRSEIRGAGPGSSKRAASSRCWRMSSK